MCPASRVLALLLAGAVALSGGGCASLSYYLQSARGQMEVLAKRRPITTIIDDPRQPVDLRERLRLVTRIRDFAVRELALPDNGSYRGYTDLHRDYVIYNVFATPELSLEPVQSCFLVVGCLDYRGFFSEHRARRHAQMLARQGYDVFVGGVAAYSTLGWFDDPVLNTMLSWDEARVARFVFHELAHQKLYIKDDTGFNEAFAETVAEVGLERWLAREVGSEPPARLRGAVLRERQFVELVLGARAALERLFASSATSAEKRVGKQRLFAELRNDYLDLRRTWGNDSSYDAWMQEELNNAKVSAVVTYHDAMPAFRTLLRWAEKDLPCFYLLAAEVGSLPSAQRQRCLARLKAGQEPADCLQPRDVAGACVSSTTVSRQICPVAPDGV
ncbi:MAG: aminopeptidase [Chromatiales bacterium]